MSDQNSISDFLDGIISAAADVDAVITEGLSNMKSKISKVEVALKSKEEKSEAKPEAKPSKELADKAIETYKTKIKPAKGAEAGELEVLQPSTKASREVMRATIRALTNRQGSGNAGKTSHVGPGGSGNVGTPGPAPITVAPLSMEEYRAQVWESFGLVAEEQDGPEPTAKQRKGAVQNVKANLNNLQNKEDEGKLSKRDKEKLALQKARAKAWGMKEELDLVSVLEDSLLASDATDWVQVDYVSRQVCLEHKVTLKELNKAFKEVHGTYPDKWIKEQTEITQCGWMPLDEVTRVNKVGLVYEVSFMHRGSVHRYKFFWPSVSRPSKEEMQKTIEGFYPKAKVLAFYPATKQDDNFMVIVPPMSEHVEVLRWDNWIELSEEANELLHVIAEEVGEPTGPVTLAEEGGYLVNVEDHDTGEEMAVTFDEGVFGLSFKKETDDEKKAKARKKKIDELERLVKHVNNPLSDVNTSKTMKAKAKQVKEDWQKTNRNDKTDGMSAKAVKQYRRENPGSKLKTAVTTPPSKLDPDSKAAKRRKNFCSRSRGWDGERGKAARARWNC